MVELKQVELRHEELQKESQPLADQRKDLSSQVATNNNLLQDIEQEVTTLQGQIDIINATEVMDVATKATLERIEAYIKESVEDLKHFLMQSITSSFPPPFFKMDLSCIFQLSFLIFL